MTEPAVPSRTAHLTVVAAGDPTDVCEQLLDALSDHAPAGSYDTQTGQITITLDVDADNGAGNLIGKLAAHPDLADLALTKLHVDFGV
jgi:hypothetical protein